MKRGEVWWADLGAHRPLEQTGRRPVGIWQSDTLARALPPVVVEPLLTSLPRFNRNDPHSISTLGSSGELREKLRVVQLPVGRLGREPCVGPVHLHLI